MSESKESSSAQSPDVVSEDVKVVFHNLDADGTGYLDKDEFREFIQATQSKEVTDRQLQRIVGRADSDENMQLCLSEFGAFLRALFSVAFSRLDKNGDGSLRRGELNKLIKGMFGGHKKASSKLQRAQNRLKQEMDKDNDKGVDLQEFVDWGVNTLADEVRRTGVINAQKRLAELRDRHKRLEAALEQKHAMTMTTAVALTRAKNSVSKEITLLAQPNALLSAINRLLRLNVSDKDWSEAVDTLVSSDVQEQEELEEKELEAREKAAKEAREEADRAYALTLVRGLKDKFAEMYAKLDLNKDGEVAFGEMFKLTKVLYPKRKFEKQLDKARRVFDKVDVDDDSRVSFEEFFQYLSHEDVAPVDKEGYEALRSVMEDEFQIVTTGWGWDFAKIWQAALKPKEQEGKESN